MFKRTDDRLDIAVMVFRSDKKDEYKIGIHNESTDLLKEYEKYVETSEFLPDPFISLMAYPEDVVVAITSKPDSPYRILACMSTRIVDAVGKMVERAKSYTEEYMTCDELRDLFVKKAIGTAEWWSKIAKEKGLSPEELSQGVTFSMLSTIDGSAIDFPACRLIPMSDDADNAYRIQICERPIPSTEHLELDDYDIAGSLHERFHLVKYEMKQAREDAESDKVTKF